MPTISIITPWSGKTAADLLPDYAAAVNGCEVVTVDNASAPETAQALKDCGGIYLRRDTNQGFAGGNNIGYAHAHGDIVVFLNSDVAPAGPWLECVVNDVKDGALYGPSLQYQLVYGMWLPYLEGWCVAATRETWAKIEVQPRVLVSDHGQPRYRGTKPPVGPWDADAYPGPYWEDNDLCLRAMLAGIGLVHTAWPIQHKGGRTAGAILKHGETFERNRATFVSRVQPVWEAKQQ